MPNPSGKAGILETEAQRAANIAKGMVPSTSFISPLQTKITGVARRPPDIKGNIKHQLYDVVSNQRLLELHTHNLPNKKGTSIPDVPHMNVEASKIASALQKRMANSLNHKKVPKPVYEAFKNFDDVAKYTKTAGKAHETVRAYRESTNNMVFIFINDVAPNGHVAINKRYMTQDEFIEILKPIVEKHNKTLEVNL